VKRILFDISLPLNSFFIFATYLRMTQIFPADVEFGPKTPSKGYPAKLFRLQIKKAKKI